MIVNGVNPKYRGGDCLKQSLAALLNVTPDSLPNWHKYPASTWKVAFTSWLEVQGYTVVERKEHVDTPHIAIFRLGHKELDELMPLHAVVCQGDAVIFDILANTETKTYRQRLVKIFDIKKAGDPTSYIE